MVELLNPSGILGYNRPSPPKAVLARFGIFVEGSESFGMRENGVVNKIMTGALINTSLQTL